MLGRVLSSYLTNVIFAACFTLRGHDTHIDFPWVLLVVGSSGKLRHGSTAILLLK